MRALHKRLGQMRQVSLFEAPSQLPINASLIHQKYPSGGHTMEAQCYAFVFFPLFAHLQG